ncbi:MAG: glycosyltransferase family 87 protein [Thermoguttaceae bacterium]
MRLLEALDRRQRWLLRLAFLLWMALAIVVSAKTLIDPALHSTYPCFESGARYWWAGRDVYRDCPHDFRYGPAFAVALGPLALLPTPLGAQLWNWLNIGVLFFTLRAMVRHVLPGGYWTPRREAAFLAVTAVGAFHTLWSGQTNLLVFSLVALGVIAARHERWSLAALLLALPVHIKIWPLAAGLLLAACRPRKLAPRLPLALLLIGGIPFLTKPWPWVCRQYAGWYQLLVGPAQVRHTYRDAWTIWEFIHAPVDPRLYAALQLGMALAALVLCCIQARRTASRCGLSLFVLVTWTTWQLVFGPGTERNTFGLIAPLSSWALIASFEEKWGRTLMTLSFVLMLVSTSGAIEHVLLPYFEWVKIIHPMGVILFFAWFLGWNAGWGCNTLSPLAGEGGVRGELQSCDADH